MINISPLIHDHQLIAVQEPRGVLDPYEIIWHRPKTTKLGRKRLIHLKRVFNFKRKGNHKTTILDMLILICHLF